MPAWMGLTATGDAERLSRLAVPLLPGPHLAARDFGAGAQPQPAGEVLDAGKARQRFERLLRTHADMAGGKDRRGRVGSIVSAAQSPVRAGDFCIALEQT